MSRRRQFATPYTCPSGYPYPGSQSQYPNTTTSRRQPPVAAHQRVQSKPHLVYFSYTSECGIGESALAYQEIFRGLGYDVEVRRWRGNWSDIEGGEDITYFHHWHPQPGAPIPPGGISGKHIAYWAYENQGFIPPEWVAATHIMQQIWCPSEFCRAIFQPFHRKVEVVPHVVSEPPQDYPNKDTRHGAFHVTFWYDAWSHACRKNPDATIRVFRRAFPFGDPANRDCRLTLKAHHLTNQERTWLQYQIKDDSRIQLVDRYLGDDEFQQLWRSTDCLLALQRSEGFGLNIAKAIARGVPVVTTGWGAHLEFARGVATTVPFNIEPASALGDDWYGQGHWAQPDEEAAIQALRQVRNNTESPATKRRLQQGINHMAITYSEEAISQQIEELLES